MIKVYRVAEMVAAEKAADASGVTYDQMMESAGRAVARAIIERLPVDGKRVTVLVGPGNNGGDGLVAGRYLAEAGADVTFYLFKSRDPESDHNLALVQEMNLPILSADFDQRYRVLRNRLQVTDILVDGLLGTGVTRPISGDLAALLRQTHGALSERESVAARQQPFLTSIAELGSYDNGNSKAQSEAAPRPFIAAVDCPSGLNCDSGELDALAIPAHMTVTFGGAKRGHFLFPGAAACGELVVADIGIPEALAEVSSVRVELITGRQAARLLPGRAMEGHKGTFGWVMIAAGSHRYWGAPILAGLGAYRAGAGLVALALPSSIRATAAARLPEATFPLIEEEKVLGGRAADAILSDLEAYKALLVGPGLYQAAEFIGKLFAEPVRKKLPPVIIDADGLNLLAAMSDWPARIPANTILTPHPGEMARLMGVPVGEVRGQDRVDLAQAKAVEWQCVVLLKGAFTVVASPDGRAAILPFANPALATAGSGDVLSGIIVALLGQDMAPFEAAVLGGYLHAAAAELSALDAGLLASDIADLVPDVMDRLRIS